MQNAELLNLPPKETSLFRKRIDKLAGITGIKIDILSLEDNVLTVRVEQVDLKNGWILNQDELSYRAKQIFKEMPQYKVHYIPLTFQPKFESITKEWISNKMKEFGLKQTDIVKHFGLDKGTVSSLLKGEARSLTRFQKSAFYFYFLNFEINKNFREYMKMSSDQESAETPVKGRVKARLVMTGSWEPAQIINAMGIEKSVNRAAGFIKGGEIARVMPGKIRGRGIGQFIEANKEK